MQAYWSATSGQYDALYLDDFQITLMKIHQILITDDDSQPLPTFLNEAIATVRRAYPDDEYRLFRKDDLRDFIRDTYDRQTLNAFDKLRPYAYKADFARYLLLYKFGDWYFDISVRVLSQITVPDEVDLVTFVDLPYYSGVSFACTQAILYSKPKNPILDDVIQTVVSNCRREYYGANALCPTGPVAFGQSVAKFGADSKNIIGTFLDLTPRFTNKNRAFVFHDGTIFALHKLGNKGGDLLSLGVTGANDYGKLYKLRQVYDTNIAV